jgi:hypothetical protein
MIRLSTLFWLVLVSVTGFAMFAVKYAVQSQEDELNRVKRATIAEEHAIRTNEAEWAYLTRPETLDEMNRRYLSLGPIATKQLRVTLTDIPLRPQPPVPVEAPPAAEPTADISPPAAPEEPAATAAPGLPATPAPPGVPATPPAPGKMARAPDLAKPPDPAKPTPAKAAAKPATPARRPASLDDLIAQIAASR